MPNNQPAPKASLSVNVPPELFARLEAEAAARGITVHAHASAVLSRALRDMRDNDNGELL